jgi:hypothetical protein
MSPLRVSNRTVPSSAGGDAEKYYYITVGRSPRDGRWSVGFTVTSSDPMDWATGHMSTPILFCQEITKAQYDFYRQTGSVPNDGEIVHA